MVSRIGRGHRNNHVSSVDSQLCRKPTPDLIPLSISLPLPLGSLKACTSHGQMVHSLDPFATETLDVNKLAQARNGLEASQEVRQLLVKRQSVFGGSLQEQAICAC
jgi:hypothetical protein